MGKAFRESSSKIRLGKTSELGMFIHYTRERTILVFVDDNKLAGKKQNINPTCQLLMKDVDLGEPTSCLDHVYFGCTPRECQISKDIADNNKKVCSNQGFLLGLLKSYQKQKPQGNLSPKRYLHGPVTWKVMQSNAWKDIANLRTCE